MSMRSLFESSTGLEAHMVLNLLQQEGIDGRVEGEYLQGGVGELQAINLVRVVVDDPDYNKAKSIIAEWEAIQPAERQVTKTAYKSSRIGLAFLFGLAAGTGATYWAFTTPVTSAGIDYDGDGRMEEKWTYHDNRIVRADIDRNRDGRTDLVERYDRRGILLRVESDDNFDGFWETVVTYQDGNIQMQEADKNQDGVVDYRVFFRNGLNDVVEILDPQTKVPRKRQKYALEKLSSAQYDSDGDGGFDVTYEYDYYEEVKSVTKTGGNE
jgi:hypothetical protein